MAQNPSPTPAGETDPSMDDILASIRRILSDEEKSAKTAAPSEGVLKLEPSMMVDEAQASMTPHIHPHGDSSAGPMAHQATDTHGTSEPLAATEPVRVPIAASVVEHLDAGSGGRVSPTNSPPTDSLIAPEAAAQAASSVGALMRTLMSERHAVVHRGGPTIEDMVREEIRPLLKGWLDRHLPDLVERLVRTEIERVVGRITG